MDSHSRRPRPLASDAGLELAAEGLSQVQLAQRLGVGSRSVGHYLAGRRRPHPDLPEVLRDLAGDDGANRVLALIPATVVREPGNPTH